MGMGVFAALLAATGYTPSHTDGLDREGKGCHAHGYSSEYHCHGLDLKPLPNATYCVLINGVENCSYAGKSCEAVAAQFGGRCI